MEVLVCGGIEKITSYNVLICITLGFVTVPHDAV